ncbi:MAG: hypothetical protein L3K10_01450 [Thermoplasmata archaeon]|nr:hypothetical protein [Thermoplasmata archaeon]
MVGHRLGALLRLTGEAIGLGVDFGTGSLEALLWVARTVEASVYVPDSLVRTPTGFAFALANPPLRVGAFSGLRLLVDGVAVAPEHVRFRRGVGDLWRASSALGPAAPLALQAGTRTEFEADRVLPERPAPVTVRLELHNVAIPPLVWLEIRESVREGPH